MEDVAVIIPTLNEEHSICPLIERVLAQSPTIFVIVIDDGSQDKTQELVKVMGLKFRGRIHLITRHIPLDGLGGAYIAGYKFAKSLGVLWVFQMDADGQHCPEDMPFLWEKRNPGRLVVGSRYCPGGIVTGWSRTRKTVSQFANAYFRILHRPGVKDCTGGFRLMPIDLALSLWIEAPRSRGFTFHAETTFRCMKYGVSITEVPITFAARSQGASKMTLASAIESIKQIWIWKYCI